VTGRGTNPILRTEQVRRLPFRRRPVAEPGTTLVFQTAAGELVCPAYPYTAGDVWWRGPRLVHIVDVGPHRSAFTEKVPAQGDVLHFDATVEFDWRVADAAAAVRDRVSDASSICRGFLSGEVRKISRQWPAMDSALAETALNNRFGQSHLDVQSGLRISNVSVALRLDPAQVPVAQNIALSALKQQLAEVEAAGEARVNRINQDADLARHKERVDFFSAMISQGLPSMVGNILAQDPTKASEAAGFMANLWEKDQKIALDAMKVILDGDQVRLGEIDGAVAAAVSRFTDIVASAGARFGAAPMLGDAATGGQGGQPALPAQPASVPAPAMTAPVGSAPVGSAPVGSAPAGTVPAGEAPDARSPLATGSGDDAGGGRQP
jgi:hypothetical protein